MQTTMSLRSTPVLVAIIAIVTVACLRLGLWQVNRLGERRAASAISLARRSLPPLTLDDGGAADTLVDRWVRAAGEFDHTHQVVIRGRVYRESPGVYVVTPLRLNGSDTAVLVNRGFVPASDAITVSLDTLDEPGKRQVTGLAIAIPSGPDGGVPLVRNGTTTWKRLDLAALRAQLPYPVLGISILEVPDGGQPRFPRRLEPLPLDDGPHLSYAIQWFAFGAIALVGGAILVTRERDRPRS